MNFRSKLLISALLLVSMPLIVEAEIVRIAAWNIENLWASEGQGQNPRTIADYERLAGYALQLDADVIAFQEIENEQALERILDPEIYRFLVSSRPVNGNFRQRTAFAVRRGIPVTRHPDLVQLRTSRGLKYGVDMEITLAGRTIRLLSVHLKSFCFEDRLSDGSNLSKHCRKLASQMGVLEKWIDEMASKDLPFAILGDFNRRLNLENDDFWSEIDDGSPALLKLYRAADGLQSECWNGKYPHYIDHIVYNQQVADWIIPGSFRQVLYSESPDTIETLSDHCPISVELDIR